MTDHRIRWSGYQEGQMPRRGDLWTCDCGTWGIAGNSSMVSANEHIAMAAPLEPLGVGVRRPWPDRAAARLVHVGLMGVFAAIAAARTAHRAVIGACEAARALRAAGPASWYRRTGERK